MAVLVRDGLIRDVDGAFQIAANRWPPVACGDAEHERMARAVDLLTEAHRQLRRTVKQLAAENAQLRQRLAATASPEMAVADVLFDQPLGAERMG